MTKPCVTHKWRIEKTFMDEIEKNKLFVKEMQKCSKCQKTRAFTYSQDIQELEGPDGKLK